MTYDIRPIDSDEVAAFRTALSIGFGSDAKPELEDRFRSTMPLERTVAAFDGDSLVGTLGDFALHIALPGGTSVPMAGTSMVTVASTHTRRGILRSMIRRHLDNAVARNEPIAGLWASEPGIYGRFGFGLATDCHFVSIDRRHLQVPDPAPDIELASITAERLLDEVAPLWSELAHRDAGFVDRGETRWETIADDPEYYRDGGSAARHVVARRAGQVVGYLQYRQKRKWVEFVAEGTTSIVELVAADTDARLALWSHALGVDLFPHVTYDNAAVDDPLSTVATNRRAVRRVVSDALYLRVLDAAVALTARRYEHDGEIVLGVNDDMGYIGGTYRLEVVDGAATVSRVDTSPDLELDCRELGSLLLGRPGALAYHQIGRIRGSAGAAATCERLFSTVRAPWCSEDF